GRGGKDNPRWRRAIGGTGRSSDSASSSWCGRAGRLRNWGGSSSPRPQAIRNWVKQAGLDAGERTDGLTTEERDEVRRLRREVRQLREERAILSKAAAWFARETTSIPSKDSSS